MMSSSAVVQSPSSLIHYAPRTHFVLKDSTRGSRPNFKRRPAALCRETAPSVPHQSAFIRNRGRNFLIEVAPFVLTLLSSSFFIFFSLLLPARATATHRGQILFKDALAQQLCEQGGEWQHPEPACTRCMFPPGHLYVHTHHSHPHPHPYPHLPPLTSHYCPSCAPECQGADESPPLRRPLARSLPSV